MLLMDVSRSGHFGSLGKTKREFAAELSALLAYSAFSNQDKIGLLLFTDRIEKFIAPNKGRLHLLQILRDLLYFEPKGKKTDLKVALNFLNRIIPRRCVVFIISDFIAKDFWNLLRITHKRHDAICVAIRDPREFRIPSVGLLALEDAETGQSEVVDTSREDFRREFEKKSKERDLALFEKFNTIGIDAIPVTVGDPYIQPLMKFFKTRQRRQKMHAA
jgi:uncharacterized protein (DUF58 family)